MVSQIDPSVPGQGTPLASAPIRDNFARAAAEITALQNAPAPGGGVPSVNGITNPVTIVGTGQASVSNSGNTITVHVAAGSVSWGGGTVNGNISVHAGTNSHINIGSATTAFPQAGTLLGMIQFQGWDGSGIVSRSSIQVSTPTTWTSTSHPTRMELRVTNPTNENRTGVTVTEHGVVVIGNASPVVDHSVQGTISVNRIFLGGTDVTDIITNLI